jgi:hypothetical protein
MSKEADYEIDMAESSWSSDGLYSWQSLEQNGPLRTSDGIYAHNILNRACSRRYLDSLPLWVTKSSSSSVHVCQNSCQRITRTNGITSLVTTTRR